MRRVGLETTRRYYRVDRRRISFIKFILEAYDNVAVVSTLEPRQAIVRVVIAPGCEDLVDAVMNGFPRDFKVRTLDEGTGTGE